MRSFCSYGRSLAVGLYKLAWGGRKRRFIFQGLLSVFLLLFFVGVGLFFWVKAEVGQSPQEAEQVSFPASSHYKRGEGRFESLLPITYHKQEGDKNILLRILTKKPLAPPRGLPVIPFSPEVWGAPTQELRLCWMGHSSLLVELEGKRFLFDPVLGNAAPIPFVIPRFQPSPLTLDTLPPVDVVILSHDHYDHLERVTVKKLADQGASFVVPLGLGARLKGWGVDSHKITELDWEQGVKVGEVEVVALPSRHYSGRFSSDKNRTLWAGFALLGKEKRLFFSGDGGYDGRFKEIGQKWGPFDITCIEVGSYNERWPHTHLFPAEAVRAHQELGGKKMLPIHWGVFDLALHEWDASIRTLFALAKEEGVELVLPRQGEEYRESAPALSHPWWEDLSLPLEKTKTPQ